MSIDPPKGPRERDEDLSRIVDRARGGGDVPNLRVVFSPSLGTTLGDQVDGLPPEEREQLIRDLREHARGYLHELQRGPEVTSVGFVPYPTDGHLEKQVTFEVVLPPYSPLLELIKNPPEYEVRFEFDPPPPSWWTRFTRWISSIFNR